MRALQARGLLTVQGEVYEVATAARVVLPDSIQGIVQSRLEPAAGGGEAPPAGGIGHGLGSVLAPVIHVHGARGEGLHRILQYLQATEFLYETRSEPAPTYIFTHTLVQEAIYGSLLPERRRTLHARTVEAITQHSPDRLSEQVEQLAHHALQGEVWDKALAYCRQAGEKAMTRSAYREAVGYCEQALGVLAHLPETRATREQAIDLQLALRSALRPLGDYRHILAVLREAESLAAALDDQHRLGQVSVFLANHFYIIGAYDQAIAAAQRTLTLARASGEVVQHALANLYLGAARQAQGDYRRAIDCLMQAVAFFDERGAGSASVKLSCPPWSLVPTSPRAMPSWACSLRAVPLGKKGSRLLRQWITPGA